MKCNYCGKEILNAGSLVVHEKYYCKSNPLIKHKKSNFTNYNKQLRSGEIQKEFANQYVKAKLTGIPYVMSEETRRKISKKSKQQVWDDDKKLRHSASMKNAVINHPLSYSAHNVCGRTKKIDYNGVRLTGTWELEVAKFFDRKGIIWTNVIKPFQYVWSQYVWENGVRNYFPDFYLSDYDLYIEVKGNQTERDVSKWSVVKNLMILKKKEIYDLKSGIDLELKPNNPYFKS